MTKFAICITKMQRMNPGVPIIRLLKDAVELRYGSKDFAVAWYNDDMLLLAMEHYLRVRSK